MSIGVVHPVLAADDKLLETLLWEAFDAESELNNTSGSEDDVDDAAGSSGVGDGYGRVVEEKDTMPPAAFSSTAASLLAVAAGSIPASPIASHPPSGREISKRPLAVAGLELENVEQPPRKKRKNTAYRERRSQNRSANLIAHGHAVPPKFRAKLISATNAIHTSLQLSALPITPGEPYIAKLFKVSPDDPDLPALRLDALSHADYAYVPWDGYTPRPLLDAQNRVFGALAGRPYGGDKGESFLNACDRLFHSMNVEATHIDLKSDFEAAHQRGIFPAVNVGLTPGQGSKQPLMKRLGRYQSMMDRLLANKDFQNLADFQNYVLCMWSPRMYEHIRTRVRELMNNSTYGRNLKPLTPAGAYPSAAFNFGPKAYSIRHRDSRNIPYGWCAIQALGQFNPVLGGHLVLDDLKQVIEFPSGSVILIPSATLVHANVPVQLEEARASITQYCPGGVLRFVDHGFQTQISLKNQGKKAQEEIKNVKKSQWEKGMSFFPNISDLIEHVD